MKRLLHFFTILILLTAFSLPLIGDPGMAKLNIFVSAMDDPCKLSSRTWYITIFDCDGNVFEWCGKRFILIPAKCGHVEVSVPPGCYYIKAVWNFWYYEQGSYYRVNHWTDAAIVQACCEKTTCVRLFNPSVHRCGKIYVRALRDLVRQKAMKFEVANQAEKAINATLKQIPVPLKKFELGIEEEIEKLLKEKVRKEEK